MAPHSQREHSMHRGWTSRGLNGAFASTPPSFGATSRWRGGPPPRPKGPEWCQNGQARRRAKKGVRLQQWPNQTQWTHGGVAQHMFITHQTMKHAKKNQNWRTWCALMRIQGAQMSAVQRSGARRKGGAPTFQCRPASPRRTLASWRTSATHNPMAWCPGQLQTLAPGEGHRCPG